MGRVMSSPHANRTRSVLIVSDRGDAALRRCADVLSDAGSIVEWVSDVYAAMARLSLSARTAYCLIVDIRQLDDYELRFLGEARRVRDSIRILVPLLDGSAERSALFGERFPALPPSRLVDVVLGELVSAEGGLGRDARVVEWGPARASTSLPMPADDGLPSIGLSAMEPVANPAAGPTGPRAGEPSAEPAAELTTEPTTEAAAAPAAQPEAEPEARESSANEESAGRSEASAPADDSVIPQPIDLTEIPDAVEIPDAIEIPEAEETAEPVDSAGSIERSTGAATGGSLSTDGGPERVSDGPAMHEAVRRRMAGSLRAFNRRRPPQRGQGPSVQSDSSDPPPRSGNAAETTALTAEEMDALLHDEDAPSSTTPQAANDPKSEPAP